MTSAHSAAEVGACIIWILQQRASELHAARRDYARCARMTRFKPMLGYAARQREQRRDIAAMHRRRAIIDGYWGHLVEVERTSRDVPTRLLRGRSVFRWEDYGLESGGRLACTRDI